MPPSLGYIHLFRKIRNHPDYPSNCDEVFNKAMAWIDIILEASGVERTVRHRDCDVFLKRGQLLFSQRYYSQRWKWTRKKVRCFIEEAHRRAQTRAHLGAHRITILTILNYDIYNPLKSREGPPRGPQKGPQKGPYSNKVKEKKKNEKLIKDSSPTATRTWLRENKLCLTKGWLWKEDYIDFILAVSIDDAYEEWWCIYPRHVEKIAAKEPFTARVKQDLFDEICQGAIGYQNYIKYEMVKKGKEWKDQIDWVKHPATFLRKERWREYIGFKYKPRL